MQGRRSNSGMVRRFAELTILSVLAFFALGCKSTDKGAGEYYFEWGTKIAFGRQVHPNTQGDQTTSAEIEVKQDLVDWFISDDDASHASFPNDSGTNGL